MLRLRPVALLPLLIGLISGCPSPLADITCGSDADCPADRPLCVLDICRASDVDGGRLDSGRDGGRSDVDASTRDGGPDAAEGLDAPTVDAPDDRDAPLVDAPLADGSLADTIDGGGYCTTHADCPITHLCEPDASATDSCASPGVCIPRPDPSACDPVVSEASVVCGCDGRSYATDCDRRAARVAAAHPGFCTCMTATDCPAPDTFCDRGVGFDCTEVGGRRGVCAALPNCDGVTLAEPGVTACGGSTPASYPNDCERRAARVEAAVFSPCTTGMLPPRGCCGEEADCSAADGDHCYAAVCPALGSCLDVPAAGRCYADTDCLPGRECAGASSTTCGSGASTGTCVLRDDAVFFSTP